MTRRTQPRLGATVQSPRLGSVLSRAASSGDPFRALFGAAPMPVMLCRPDGVVVDHNPAAAELLDGTGLDLREASLGDLGGFLAGDHAEALRWQQDLEAVARLDLDSTSLHIWLTEAETAPRPVQVTVAHIALAGEDLLLAHLRDGTGVRTENQRLIHLATHDALTGLPNRELVLRRLVTALEHSAETGVSVAVLYLDLDLFKTVNDTYGHHAGDALLAELGSRLGKALRATDTAGRLGGDEFLVVAPNVPNVAALAELRRRIEEIVIEPVEVGGVLLDLRPSVGAVLSRDGEQPSVVVRRADAAMYAAKRARRRLTARRRTGPTHVERQMVGEQAIVAEGR